MGSEIFLAGFSRPQKVTILPAGRVRRHPFRHARFANRRRIRRPWGGKGSAHQSFWIGRASHENGGGVGVCVLGVRWNSVRGAGTAAPEHRTSSSPNRGAADRGTDPGAGCPARSLAGFHGPPNPCLATAPHRTAGPLQPGYDLRGRSWLSWGPPATLLSGKGVRQLPGRSDTIHRFLAWPDQAFRARRHRTRMQCSAPGVIPASRLRGSPASEPLHESPPEARPPGPRFRGPFTEAVMNVPVRVLGVRGVGLLRTRRRLVTGDGTGSVCVHGRIGFLRGVVGLRCIHVDDSQFGRSREP